MSMCKYIGRDKINDFKKQQEKINFLFSCLSGPTRLAILFFLFEQKQANVSQIIDHVSISQSGVSHQLQARH